MVNIQDLKLIATADTGTDRDNCYHADREFYENMERKIFFRDVYHHWQERVGENGETVYNTTFSGYEPYEGRMTKEEIIAHPGWAIHYEELAIKERKCEMDLEKITETQSATFKAHKGMMNSRTEYFECGCCSQLYFRERWHLVDTGSCEIDGGYTPEVHLDKGEVLAHAPLYRGSMTLLDKLKIMKEKKQGIKSPEK